MLTRNDSTITILMLEPDMDDRFITTSVLGELSYPVHLEFASYGHEIFEYFDACNKSGKDHPSLILLSLTANIADGQSILKQLKADNRYKHIPVIVLTGVRQQNIIRECYALGASSFIQKPMSAAGTTAKISNFFRYWLETAELA